MKLTEQSDVVTIELSKHEAEQLKLALECALAAMPYNRAISYSVIERLQNLLTE